VLPHQRVYAGPTPPTVCSLSVRFGQLEFPGQVRRFCYRGVLCGICLRRFARSCWSQRRRRSGRCLLGPACPGLRIGCRPGSPYISAHFHTSDKLGATGFAARCCQCNTMMFIRCRKIRPCPFQLLTNVRSSTRDILKNIHRNSKGLMNYYNSSQIHFPRNSNQYRFNNEFIINQKLLTLHSIASFDLQLSVAPRPHGEPPQSG
jgi:hypothetical protein